MHRLSSPPGNRIFALWPLVAALVPALTLLGMIWRLRVPVPYADSWAFVEQYLDWAGGKYGWGDFFAKHGDHPAAVGKAIYFAVMQWFHGDVGMLPLLSWALTLLVGGCVFLLGRSVWAGNPALGAVLMLCMSLTLFSTAQGGVWLWDFTFQNYIPGACLALGAVLLTKGENGVCMMALAALLSVAATFSFGAGFMVGVFFSILIWHGMHAKSLPRKLVVSGCWLVAHGMVAWIALKAFGPSGFTEEGSHPGLMVLVDRPFMRIQFVLVLLGQMFGKGSVFEPLALSAVVGGALVLVFASCLAEILRRRKERAFFTACLPWLVFSLYGLCSALLICIGRMGPGTDTFASFNNIYALAERTMAERFIISTLFFVLGVVMLAAVVVRFSDGSPMVRLMKKASIPALAVFLLLQISNWQSGAQMMRLENSLMKQEQAMLGFGPILKLDPDRLWNRQLKYHTFRLAKALSQTGRLHGVNFVTDNNIGYFHQGAALPMKRAKFDMCVLQQDGSRLLGGTCGMIDINMRDLPDLVVITAEVTGAGERIVGIGAPRLPETFFERKSQRMKYPGHYFGWSLILEPEQLPEGARTLHAYGLDSESRTVFPINGTQKVE